MAHYPDVYLYNPTADMAILNGTISYMPPERLRIFENDLSTLPSILANNNDIVISPNKPSESFQELLSLLNIPQLNYLSLNDLKDQLPKNLNRIISWSWSPATHHAFKTIKPYCSQEYLASPNYKWKESKNS